jgi:ABC-type transporter Mla maintaining outer membrane lipid asymmetry ATPase subunit MlaF
MAAERLLTARQVRKEYGGLRPLRLEALVVAAGESVALVGFDQTSAQVLVDLLTGAVTPDSGEVEVLGQSTAAIPDADSWLALLDHVGILSGRAVLLESMTVEQNLALPFTLEMNPIPADIRARVLALASDVGLDAAHLPQAVGAVSGGVSLRVRLGRALALGPRLLLAEHPNALADAADLPAFATALRTLGATRGLTSIVVTADPAFAALAADRVLTFEPATGLLHETRSWAQRLTSWRR